MFGYYVELAWLSLRRNRVLTALMVLAIAVGIGASMTTLTVVHLLGGNPLPGRSAHIYYPQLSVDLSIANPTHPRDIMDYRSAMDLWRAHRADRQTLVIESDVRLPPTDAHQPALMAQMLSTTADFFPMFDVPFQYGGGWSDDDDQRHARVAVISADLNNKLFRGENSVGRMVRLRNTDVRIVGVLKPWRPSPLFYMVHGGNYSDGQTSRFYRRAQDLITPFFTGIDINDDNFLPFTCWGNAPAHGHLEDAPCIWVMPWVQLDSAAKASAYRAFLAGYAQQQKQAGRYNAALYALPNLDEWLVFNQVVPGDARLQLWLSLAFLLICLFNMVGLLLAKFLRREAEIGVRRALGATRQAVFKQYLIEAGAIGVLGGFGGWLLTLLGLSLIRSQPVEYADMARLDLPMFVLTFLLAVLCSLLAGVLPAFRAGRISPSLQLKTE